MSTVYTRLLAVAFVAAFSVAAGAQHPAGAAAQPRNPFWPVGYTPPIDAPPPPPPPPTNTIPSYTEPAKPDPLVIERMAAELARKIRAATKVQAIMKTGDRQFASINGRVVAAGDRLEIVVDGQVYRFKITNISASVVNMEPVNP